MRIGLIGDFDAEKPSHRATHDALTAAAGEAGAALESSWIGTESLLTDDGVAALLTCDGVWVAPGSPYHSLEGALAGIRAARESDLPVLGTCGGFQHIVLEYARNVLGMPGASHQEYDPEDEDAIVTLSSCAIDAGGGPRLGGELRVTLDDGSRVRAVCGRRQVVERFNCSFELNRRHEPAFASGPLRIVGRGDEGEARVVEMDGSRFFVATLFLPQMRPPTEGVHPIVRAFVEAAAERATSRSGATARR